MPQQCVHTSDLLQNAHLIFVGSPRAHGVSAAYAQRLRDEYVSQGEDPAYMHVIPLASLDFDPCDGCAGCATSGTCIKDDDMQDVYACINKAARIDFVSPVYFAGPPALTKGFLDRLQPYWEQRLGRNGSKAQDEVKRPVVVHVIGAGGDPHGFDPLVGIMQSAWGAAGFYIDEIVNAVGWTPKDTVLPYVFKGGA